MSELAVVASTAHRLAVLLAAGVSPVAAWSYLDARPNSVVARVADQVGNGVPVAEAILGATLLPGAGVGVGAGANAGGVAVGVPAGGGGVGAHAGAATGTATPARRGATARDREAAAWRALAAAWHVASEAGAPLAPTLRHSAASLRGLADAQREMHTALAAPVATAKLVMALPLVGVLFALVLGFDPLGTLFTNPLGLACLVAGLALVLAGHRWNRALIARAQPTDVSPGLWCELTAIAVSGGGALERAIASVDAAAEACGIHSSPTEAALVSRTVELSSRAGVPAGELLRAEAEEQRRQARADAASRAASLSVRLMLPLGVCVLPAFMVLGVAPLLISVIGSTVAGF